VRAVFARRRQLSTRSQTADRLLQKLNDDSRPQSVVFYDHVTLCQRHRQQHLHQSQQQQQHCTSSLNAFPLLLQPCEHLAADTIARSTAGRNGDIVLPYRSGHPLRIAPASGNPTVSSMTSFAFDCGDAGDVSAGDACLSEDTHATVM